MAVTRGRAPNSTYRENVSTMTPAFSNGSAPLHSRERILGYGKEGAGKSNGWLTIAEAYPDIPVFCIDTDDSVQRLLETDYADLHNVHAAVAQNWEDFDKHVEEFLKRIAAWVAAHPPKRKEDYPWLVIDMSDVTWDMVQNYFTEQVFSKGIDDYFLQTRIRMAKSGGSKENNFEGWTDWPVINKIFQAVWNKVAKGGGPYHLFITAGTAPITGLENKSLYQHLKMMPRGEKRMGHRVHTVLMFHSDAKGWYISSAKDRGRQLLDEHRVMNFSISYLRKIAGWEA